VLQLPVTLGDLNSLLGIVPMYYMWILVRQSGWLFEILNRLDKHVRVVQLHVQPLSAKRWRRLYQFCHKVCYRLSPHEEHSRSTRIEIHLKEAVHKLVPRASGTTVLQEAASIWGDELVLRDNRVMLEVQDSWPISRRCVYVLFGSTDMY
jgi:hypothetical protein